jgi:hypothetical protein
MTNAVTASPPMIPAVLALSGLTVMKALPLPTPMDLLAGPAATYVTVAPS